MKQQQLLVSFLLPTMAIMAVVDGAAAASVAAENIEFDNISRDIFNRYELTLQKESIAVTTSLVEENPTTKLSKLQLLSSSKNQQERFRNHFHHPSESGDDEGPSSEGSTRNLLRTRELQQSTSNTTTNNPILTGLATNFVCDTPLHRLDDSPYVGRSLCRYSESPYEDYNNILGCYCTNINDILLNNVEQSSEDCECVIVFWTNTYLDIFFCRSVSIVDNSNNNTIIDNDGTFKLQYDCSNVFEQIDNQEEEERPCVGRDQNGNCFDIDTVPSPISNDAIVMGRYDELTCMEEPLPESSASMLPEFFAGKYQCNSPLNPPRGFPYPRTDSYVGLLCPTQEPNEGCDCFVSITHPPDVTNHCNACELVPTGDNTTYQISFDCTNFYTAGDCVGVDENGGCLGGKNCQGEGVLAMNCDELFELETCIIEDDDDDSSSFGFFRGGDPCDSNCNDECDSVKDCSCLYGFSIGLFGQPTGRVACQGTTDVVCSNFVTENTCGDRADFNCEWVSN